MAKLILTGRARALPPQPVDVYMMHRVRHDPKIRLTTSPFGLTPEEIKAGVRPLYVSDAVPWKGLKVKYVGAKFTEEARKHVGKKGVGLLEGLRKAIAISKAYKDVKGVGIDPETGRYMPKKAIEQKGWKRREAEINELKAKIKFPGEPVKEGDILVGGQ